MSACFICDRTPDDGYADIEPMCDKHDGVNATGVVNRFVSRQEWNDSLPAANAVRAMLRDLRDAYTIEETA